MTGFVGNASACVRDYTEGFERGFGVGVRKGEMLVVFLAVSVLVRVLVERALRFVEDDGVRVFLESMREAADFVGVAAGVSWLFIRYVGVGVMSF